MNMNINEIEEKLNDLISEVKMANADFKNYNRFKLEDISVRITNLCNAATSLPNGGAMEVKPLLEILRDDLTKLSKNIQQANEGQDKNIK